MAEKNVVIRDKVGLHARTAAALAEKAKQFSCDIKIRYNAKEVNAKSMLALMGLGVKSGVEITIHGSGPDEEKAVEVIRQLIERNFEDQ